jgi:DNA-binding PucR family transcriptional regulator
MPATETSLTVDALWDLAMPPGTELAGGAQGLSRRVEWVAALRASFPMFGELGEGYLALACLEIARNLDPYLTVARLIEELAGVQAAALVLDEPLTTEDAALADRLGLPVLVAPAHTDLRQLERDLLRALVDREGQWARREVEARRLLQQAYDRHGLPGLAEALTRLIAAPVAIADAHGRLLAGEAASEVGDAVAHAEFAIQGSGRTLGCVLLASPTAELRPVDALYARQAADICALEMLQQVARQETEERLGADLVEALLGDPVDSEGLSARLTRLGYPFTDTDRHLVIALGSTEAADEAVEQAARALRLELQAQVSRLLQVRHHSGALILSALKPAVSERRLRDLLARHSAGEVVLGVGRTATGLTGLRASLRQALEACALGARLRDRRGPYYYEDLGLYRLLAGLHSHSGSPSREEIARFYSETLGPLVCYDREHDAQLVETLEALFEANANASQAAARLSIHRNTLSYRLRRIAEITGLDLANPEIRLALQVALAVHRITH